MTTRKSQLTKSAEIHKPVSKNKTCELAQSCSSISQRGIKRGGAVDRELKGIVVNQTQTNNTAPRPTKEEINQLAKAWCEMLLGQVMEERNQQKLIGANSVKTIENINRDNLAVRKIYAVRRTEYKSK